MEIIRNLSPKEKYFLIMVNALRDSIKALFNFAIIEETEEKVIFNIVSDKTAVLDKKYCEKIFDKISKLSSKEDIELYSTQAYEVLVQNESRILYGKDKELEQIDNVNKIVYKLCRPSDEYLVFFLLNLNKQNIQNFRGGGGMVHHRLRRMFENSNSNQILLFELSILDIIKEVVPRLETLQIRSDAPKRLEDFEKLLYAFIFNLGYNVDYTILPLRFIEEFTQPYRMGRFRRTTISEVEYPKRIYNNELILHYQKGISSESLDHQFLSFFHVLEHFFERIYNEDIINNIKSELTKPDFSYKRVKDLQNLVSVIQNKLKYKNDEFLINELEALELTIKKYIPELILLKKEVEEVFPDLIDHYKTNEVAFSKGNRINFDNSNNDETYKNISKRIYFTRNAIVHSKETDKAKYTPFKDDKNLLKEIYLIRLIAEFVIIGNSKDL